MPKIDGDRSGGYAIDVFTGIVGPDRLEKGQKTQGDLPPELFGALGLLLSCKLNLHLAQLACLGNQEISNGKDR